MPPVVGSAIAIETQAECQPNSWDKLVSGLVVRGVLSR